jgi:MFS family permease
MQDIKSDTIDNEKSFQLDWSARLMFVAILSSIFLAAMDQTVVSTALPTIARDMSGLELLYLLVGMLSMSIMAGRRISHKQRYREFPIIGALLITVSLGWLSRLGAQTPMWHIDAALVLLGLGLGMTMQVLVLSAQLAIPHKNLGVATSTVTLFRSMGGTLGVAAFGAVFSGLMAGVASSAEHAAMIVQTLRTDFLIAASFSLAAFVGAWFLEDMQILLKKRQDR